MTTIGTRLRGSALCGLLLCFVSLPAFAQSDEFSFGEPVCMVRKEAAADGAKGKKGGNGFSAIVVERSVPRMESRGFVVGNCEELKLAKAQNIATYRNRVCKLASKGNKAVQNQLEKKFGERPSALCANAEAVAGRWSRGKGK